MSHEVLEFFRDKHPELNEHFNTLQQLFGNKFWHQYGEELLTLCYNESIQNSDDVLTIHESIIYNPNINLNPLVLSKLTMLATQRLKTQKTLQEQLDFIQKTIDTMHNQQAKILLELQKAYCTFEDNQLGTAYEK